MSLSNKPDNLSHIESVSSSMVIYQKQRLPECHQ